MYILTRIWVLCFPKTGRKCYFFVFVQKSCKNKKKQENWDKSLLITFYLVCTKILKDLVVFFKIFLTTFYGLYWKSSNKKEWIMSKTSSALILESVTFKYKIEYNFEAYCKIFGNLRLGIKDLSIMLNVSSVK